MKRTLVFLFAVLFSGFAFAQTLKKYPVSNSGCSVYMFCAPTFELSKSQDSSSVYTAECVAGDISYGVICVKLLNPLTDLDMAEGLLIAYADHLKTSFDIQHAMGYGKGHRLNNNEKTRGILDYWQDNAQQNWKIKAWTDGKYIGFLYAYSKKELPEQKVNLFLDGFRLP